jgi:hypothetical protein
LIVLFSAGVLVSPTVAKAQEVQPQAGAELMLTEQVPVAPAFQMQERLSQMQERPTPRPAARLVYVTRPRPAWVIPMHVATAMMQGLDAHSTFTAFDAGAVEGNPLAAGFAEHRPAFAAFKMGVAAGMIYATEKMSRRHPVAAFITATAINSAYAYVAMHNYRVARTMR